MHNVHASSDLDAIRPAIHRRFSLLILIGRFCLGKMWENKEKYGKMAVLSGGYG